MLEHAKAEQPAVEGKRSETMRARRFSALRFPRGWEWLYVPPLLAAAALIAFNVFQPITVLPRITTSPGYAFHDQDGELVTSEDYRGRFTLYSFSHSTCTEGCALSLTQIANLRSEVASRLPDDADVSLVTISVDPEFDSSDELRSTVERMSLPVDQPPIAWTLLSGDPLRTKMAVGSGFSLYYSEATSSNDDGNNHRSVTFDPRYYLVDGWGLIRAEYRTAEPDPDIIARDVKLLIQEAENSDGVIRLGYEAAHLFSCYPR